MFEESGAVVGAVVWVLEVQDVLQVSSVFKNS
jgi:hypothetical protein